MKILRWMYVLYYCSDVNIHFAIQNLLRPQSNQIFEDINYV